MVLYKIIYRTDTHSLVTTREITKWAGSGKEAGQIRKQARQKIGYVPNSVKTDKIDVPTNKIGLIEFLNKQ